ncbi:hypothetical protein OG369_41545 [Streptomyces sp. NBC_01221]|uniref:hypothetical protein n=1 Tax=Streptomyces TaxID=1883 RepID=UPI001670F88C|nr:MULTISPECIES: hypothetical protein [Streptomyces]MCX4792289.1 hypothetical protein [Streptomyces sp. NBC_01221]WPW26453.1 hypothetical protein P6B95_02625 [Streptomyces atratus]GGT73803.1 hypothetical protein GCM10010207_84300 [Streptomyces atratus]
MRSCYNAVLRSPAECFRCGTVQPLIARDDDGAGVCGPCVGFAADYTCRQCMQRWVLDTPVWEKLLTEAGFTNIATDSVRDPGTENQPPMTTTLIRAVRGSS